MVLTLLRKHRNVFQNIWYWKQFCLQSEKKTASSLRNEGLDGAGTCFSFSCTA